MSEYPSNKKRQGALKHMKKLQKFTGKINEQRRIDIFCKAFGIREVGNHEPFADGLKRMRKEIDE